MAGGCVHARALETPTHPMTPLESQTVIRTDFLYKIFFAVLSALIGACLTWLVSVETRIDSSEKKLITSEDWRSNYARAYEEDRQRISRLETSVVTNDEWKRNYVRSYDEDRS